MPNTASSVAPPGADAGPPTSASNVRPAVARLRQTAGCLSQAYLTALRHWLLSLNLLLGLLIAGAFAAPILAAVGLAQAAESLYAAYHLICHQWPFRTFFLFGPQPIYDQADLVAQNLDPFRFLGDQAHGWKMGFCERDLAIYVGLLAVGLFYAHHRHLRPAGFAPYAVLILPMAVDGFTQLFGWRESTWQLRASTGLLFGVASGWLVLPRLDPAFGRPVFPAAYAPDNDACDPLPPATPVAPLSRAG
ncbi:MAG TPA: DUF2085 domain-containing protein [Chloroflexota bacterium]|nr:DUF2085 domain-containing protein [Chloroflexota bacterium]